MEFRLGELFCGAGGIGLGAKTARVNNGRIKHVWATDMDEDACATYEKNINPRLTLSADIRKLKFKTLSDAGDIDALSFGFPCNDFSAVGKKSGVAGNYGALYTYCVKAVKFFKPKWFFAENVGGLMSSDKGSTLPRIMKEFEKCGYDIHPHLYSFDLYGVPQRRQRIIIVGIRKDLKIDYKPPSPKPFKNINVSTSFALSGIPQTAANQEMTKQSKTVIARLKHIKPGENAFTSNLPENLRLNVKGVKISSIYRRLHPDKPSYTVTASGGGGTHVYHYHENRALTNRERARLQSFPDDFVFAGKKESVRKQIGMSVPPVAAKIIFESILKSFLGRKYPTTASNIKF